MRKIMILGCCGAGKSTFARKLHQIIGLKLIHLDQQYWQPNWTEPNKDDWRKEVENLANQPEWIIDGNYGSTIDIRLKKADTIILLDYPTPKCLWRVIKRIVKNYGKVRPDMPEGCAERFDWEFLHYVAVFNIVQKPKLLQKIEAVKTEKKVFIFKNDKEAQLFLDKLSKLK